MEQILMNLAVNARDAMPEGGRILVETVNVTLDREFCKEIPECEPGEYVLLKVTDTGHGMDRTTVEHIFEPFFTTKEQGKGTGLGLATVYGIVKSHGGHILCESERDRGTVFKIYLPAVRNAVQDAVGELEEEKPAGGAETILVVEDEETLRELASQVLRRMGYRVLAAENGEKALALYEENREEISVVLLDLIMPGMGGKRCLEELLKRNPLVKIVIASGYTGEDSRSVLLEKGARGFVAKPYDMKRVLRMIREVLDSPN
jgi:CheY-like chemotaxis protein